MNNQDEKLARLMASAPELLEALEDLMQVARMFPDELSKEHYAVKNAQAAIAKAKGE